MRFSGIVVTFATSLVARCMHAPMHSHANVKQAAGFLAVSQLEHAGPARPMGNGADLALVYKVGVQSLGESAGCTALRIFAPSPFFLS